MLEEVSVPGLVLISFQAVVRSTYCAGTCAMVFWLSELYLCPTHDAFGSVAEFACSFGFSVSSKARPVHCQHRPGATLLSHVNAKRTAVSAREESRRSLPAGLGLRQPPSSPAGTSWTTWRWTTSRLSRSRGRPAWCLWLLWASPFLLSVCTWSSSSWCGGTQSCFSRRCLFHWFAWWTVARGFAAGLGVAAGGPFIVFYESRLLLFLVPWIAVCRETVAGFPGIWICVDFCVQGEPRTILPRSLHDASPSNVSMEPACHSLMWPPHQLPFRSPARMLWFLLYRKKAELLTDSHHDVLDAARNHHCGRRQLFCEGVFLDLLLGRSMTLFEFAAFTGKSVEKSGQRDVEEVYETVHEDHRLQSHLIAEVHFPISTKLS